MSGVWGAVLRCTQQHVPVFQCQCVPAPAPLTPLSTSASLVTTSPPAARSTEQHTHLLCTCVGLWCAVTCNTITHLIVLFIEVNNSFILQRHSSLLLIAALPICKYLMRKHSIMHNSHISVGSWLEYKYLTLLWLWGTFRFLGYETVLSLSYFHSRHVFLFVAMPSCHSFGSSWLSLVIRDLPSCCIREKPQKIFFLNLNDNMF